jgi:hypothetical protein
LREVEHLAKEFLETREAAQKGTHSIDVHRWRVDRQGIIRGRLNQPVGVWGVDFDKCATPKAR